MTDVLTAMANLTALHHIAAGLTLDPTAVCMVALCLAATSLALSGLRVVR